MIDTSGNLAFGAYVNWGPATAGNLLTVYPQGEILMPVNVNDPRVGELVSHAQAALRDAQDFDLQMKALVRGRLEPQSVLDTFISLRQTVIDAEATLKDLRDNP